MNARNFQVEHDKVTTHIGQCPQCGGRVACRQSPVSDVPKDLAQSIARTGIVVNN
jgi:hypothetical protein